MCVFSTGAWAQLASQTGLVGTVRDSGGGVIPGASVTAVNVETQDTYETVTNEAGQYNIPNVRLGRYSITIALTGFKTFKATGLDVAANQIVRRDAVLEVGGCRETVTVAAASTVLATDRATVSETIDPRAVSELPVAAATSGTWRPRRPGCVREHERHRLQLPGRRPAQHPEQPVARRHQLDRPTCWR